MTAPLPSYPLTFPSSYPDIDILDNVSISVDDSRTEKLEDLLTRWRSRLFVNMWLQEKSMYFYGNVNNALTYPVIVISSVSSATLFSTNNIAIKYVVGGLSLVTGILTSIARQMRPAELYQQYAITTLRYQALVRRIETYLSLPMAMREEDPLSFMRKFELEMTALMENQVNPPPYVKAKFQKRFGPLDKIVYGEAILELLRKDMVRNMEREREFKRAMKVENSRGGTISKYLPSRLFQ